MKTKTIRWAAGAVIGAALLAACGGGDDDLSGGQTAFTIVPDEGSVKGPAQDVCPGGGNITRVQIIGGSPPYQIFNTNTQFLAVSATVVNDQAGYFEVTWLGGCFENLAVTVRDVQNRLAVFSASAVEGD